MYGEMSEPPAVERTALLHKRERVLARDFQRSRVAECITTVISELSVQTGVEVLYLPQFLGAWDLLADIPTLQSRTTLHVSTVHHSFCPAAYYQQSLAASSSLVSLVCDHRCRRGGHAKNNP
jgi:hypothetical protein